MPTSLVAGTREGLGRGLRASGLALALLGTLVVALSLAACGRTAAPNLVAEELAHPAFGQIRLVRPATGDPKGTVLLLAPKAASPDWPAVANTVAGLNYLVALIDSDHYLDWLAQPEPPCSDVAADLAALAAFIASHRHLTRARPPILLGFGQGATLVYAALAQDRPGALHTAISVDFCPRLALSEPLCSETGLHANLLADGSIQELAPVEHLATNWFVFQSPGATGCAVGSVRDFISRLPAAKPTELPGPAVEDGKLSPEIGALLNWLDPSIAAQVQTSAAITGLPLIEARAPGPDPLLALMLSGDGGWAKLDRSIAEELNKRGISVVGWDTLSYFWEKKTPETAAEDLAKVIRHYLESWGKRQVLLIGYSFGADVLPFMLNRLSPELRSHLVLAVMLGLGERIAFEFHLSNWISGGEGDDTLPVPPEVAALDWIKRLCVYGSEESNSACPGLAERGLAVIRLPGDHHFGGDYPGLTRAILEHLPADAGH